MKGGDGRGDPEGEFEPPGKINDHADGGDHHGDQGVVPEALADFGADFGGAFHDELVVFEFLGKSRHDLVRDLCFLGFEGFFDLDQELVPFREMLKFAVAKPARLQSLPGLLHLQGFFKFQLEGRSAGEVDAQIGLAAPDLHQGHEADAHENRRKDEGVFPHPDKVDVGFS